MKTNFTIFAQQAQKPEKIYINKGVVNLVNSNENFWVKYSEIFANDVRCNVNNGNLNIEANKDNIEITVNLSQLQRCAVNLDSGIMSVFHTCKVSDMRVGAGTMNVHINKNIAGIVKAHVGTGILNNHSDLVNHNDNHAHQGFGWFNFGHAYNTSNDANLIGNIQDASANFTIDTGVLDIGG